jgi:prevent-host-death family protein
MRSIAAGKFKDTCLKTLDEVARSKTPVVITKRGKPLATLVPYVRREGATSLAGSIVKEVGDPYGTGEPWSSDGDAS